MMFRFLVPGCLALLVACGDMGDDGASFNWTRTFPTTNENITLTVRVDHDSITVDETVHAEIVIVSESTIRASMPDPKQIPLESLILRRWQLFPAEPEEDERMSERMFLTLEPTLPGEAIIGPFAASYEEKKDGEWIGRTIKSMPVTLVVGSLGVPEEGPVELRPPRGVAWPRINRLPLIVGLGAGLLVLFGLLYWFFLRRSRLVRPPIPPYRIALRELSELEKRGLIERGELMRYYMELGDAVRRYIEGTFPIPAMELTTPELTVELRSHRAIEAEQQNAMRNLFDEADLVKFAKHRPDRESAREKLYQAKDFVRATSPREEQPDGV